MGNVFYVTNATNVKYRKIKKELANYSLVVMRVNCAGKLVNSKPCIDCLSYLKSLGIKNIYYSNDASTLTREKTKNINTTHICRSRKFG